MFKGALFVIMISEKICMPDEKNISSLTTPQNIEKKILSRRVNINDLLSRAREEKKKENKINLVFFGLFSSIIFVVGIILSF